MNRAVSSVVLILTLVSTTIIIITNSIFIIVTITTGREVRPGAREGFFHVRQFRGIAGWAGLSKEAPC